MARTARAKKDDEPSVVHEKDFDLAVKLWREDIERANSAAGASNKDASDAYKSIKKNAHIQPDAARKAFKLMGKTEDAARDDWFRGFVGIVNRMANRTVLTFHSDDLVDRAQTEDGYARPKDTGLATLYDGDNEDLAGGEEPAPGTSAAAIAAMKASAED